MTDAEWNRLEPFVSPEPRKGGRPTDRRHVWDAIFWVACSNRPWRELPSELGRPDTAHRALRRAGQTGRFPLLLLLVSDDPDLGGWEAMRYRLCRAVRRVCKIIPLAVTWMANRLGLRDALPCATKHLPMPGLSETIAGLVRSLRRPAPSDAVQPLGVAIPRAEPPGIATRIVPPAPDQAGQKPPRHLDRRLFQAAQAEIRLLFRLATGRFSAWRLTA